MKKLNKLLIVMIVMLTGSTLSMKTASAEDVTGLGPTYFVPMSTPCRIFDTRQTDNRFVGSPSGDQKEFYVWGGGFFIEQQGGTGGGYIEDGQLVPDGSVNCLVARGSVAVNISITAVRPDSKGYLRVWPSGQDEPTASMMDWSTVNISKSLAVGFNFESGKDLSIKVYKSGVHLVGDVLGYYIPAD